MHRFTEDKGVTVSWFTSDVDSRLEHLKGQGSFRLRTPEIIDESGKVRVFVATTRRTTSSSSILFST